MSVMRVGLSDLCRLRQVAIALVVAVLAAAASFAQEEISDRAPDAETAVPKPSPGERDAKEPPSPAPPGHVGDSVCLMVESAARAHGLPVEFFARVIWQESRFRADAIGPLTRSGRRAAGIAQFMPGTAAERGLLDPFDPVQALPKSAEFLKELRAEFGNLGLAAAAYNAGPRRVREWMAGTGYMPQETRSYVAAITGKTVDDWAKLRGAAKADDGDRPSTRCGDLMALLKRSPNPFLESLEQRVALTVASPWGVQLAANFSRERALESYARVMARFNAILGDEDPTLLRTLLRSRGTRPFYQVRVGAQTRGDANALCKRIRGAGGACMVLRNKGAPA
jgi:hypothetical protein